MTDGELRGIVLEKFYELRHEKDVLQLPGIDSFCQHEPIRIANICEQLGQHGLIEKEAKSLLERIAANQLVQKILAAMFSGGAAN